MFDFIKDSPLIGEARAARLRPRFFGQLLIFWVVSLIIEIAVSLLPSFYASLEAMRTVLSAGSLDPATYAALLEEAMAPIMASDTFLLLSLFSTFFMLILSAVYCCCIEKRSLRSMGLRGSFLREYGVGLAIGLLMIGGSFLICYLTGAVTVSPGKINWGLLLLYFVAFLIQGAAEEMMLRGYFTLSLTNSTSPLWALFTGAVFFAALHSANTGFGLLPFVNTFLFGLLLSFYILKRGSIYGAAALHGIWNFAGGLIFGLPISGMQFGTSILSSENNLQMTITNGGLYGPEGGCAVTIILIIAFLILLYFPGKKEKSNKLNG